MQPRLERAARDGPDNGAHACIAKANATAHKACGRRTTLMGRARARQNQSASF